MATISLGKKALLGFIFLTMFLVPAAAQEIPADLPAVLEMVTDYLGTGPGEGVDFMLAFVLVFAAFYLGLSLVPKFTETDTAKAAIAVFAGGVAFGTAFYVYINEIPFLGVIGPYALIVIPILLGVFVLKMIFSIREEGLAGVKAPAIGIFLIILGASVAFLIPGVMSWGVLTLFFGLAILVLSLLFWVGRRVTRPPPPPGAPPGAPPPEEVEREEEKVERAEEREEREIREAIRRADKEKIEERTKKELEDLEKELEEVRKRLETIKGRCRRYTERILELIRLQIQAMHNLRSENEAGNLAAVERWREYFHGMQRQKEEQLRLEKECLARKRKVRKREKIKIKEVLRKVKWERRLTKKEERQLKNEFKQIKLLIKEIQKLSAKKKRTKDETNEIRKIVKKAVDRAAVLTKRIFTEDRVEADVNKKLLATLGEIKGEAARLLGKGLAVHKHLDEAINLTRRLVEMEEGLESNIKKLYGYEKRYASAFENTVRWGTFLENFIAKLESYVEQEEIVLKKLQRILYYEERYL